MSKTSRASPPATLTPIGCLECGKPPEYKCSYCPAVLCEDCLAKHEDERHLVGKPRDSKKANTIKFIDLSRLKTSK